MPNQLVEHFRQQFPNDPRSDDEITLRFVSRHGLESLADYPDVISDYKRIDKQIRKATAPSLPGEFTKAFGSGVDQVQAKLYDTAALAGEVLGSDTVKNFGEAGYNRNLQEAAQNAPTIPTVEDIEGPSEGARYLAGLVGSQAPQIALTTGAAIAGGLIGGLPGATIGAGLTGFTQMQNRGELRSSPGVDQSSVIPAAIATGAIGSLLEALVPLKVTNKLLKGASDEAAKHAFARILKDVPVNAIEEGGTEVLQELTTMAGELYANRNNKDFKFTPEAVKSRLLNAGLAGAILGGASGVVEGIPGHRNNGEIEREGNDDTDTTAAISPAAGPIVEPLAPIETSAAYARPTGRDAALAALIEPDEFEGGDSTEETNQKGRQEIAPLIERSAAGDIAPPQPIVTPELYSQIQDAALAGDESRAMRPVGNSVAGFNLVANRESAGAVPQIQEQVNPEVPSVANDATTQPAPSTTNDNPISNQLVVPGTVKDSLTVPPRVPFDLEKVDWYGRGYSESAKRKLQPGFTEITKDNEVYSPELAEKLTADAAASSNVNSKSVTRRIVFVEDQNTGEILGLPIWKRSGQRDGTVVYVTDPTKESGRNLRLSKLMEQGFVPVASFRRVDDVNGTDRSNITRYEDFSEFEGQVLQPARERLAATGRYEGATAAHMQAQGFDPDGNIIEKLSPENMPEEDPASAFRSAIVEELSKSRDLSRDGIARAVFAVGSQDDNVTGYLAAMRALLSDQAIRESVATLDKTEAQKFLAGKLTDAIYEQANKIGINEPGRLSEGDGNSGGSLEIGGDLFSRPEQSQDPRAGKGDIKARFNHASRLARDFGITVDIVKAVGKEVGSFSGKERKITLALFDAENPTPDNLRLMLHEIAHDISRGVPESVRSSVHRAIDSYSDEALQIERSLDPRIRSSNPSALPAQILSEERLAEHLALQGLVRGEAQTVSNQIVRFLKALYFRIAMALQRLFGRNPSPELALGYVRNRFEQLTSGDPQGLFRYLIPPKIYGGGGEDDVFSTPKALSLRDRIGERLDPRVIVETRIATLNEQVELATRIETELARIPSAVSAAQEAGVTPIEWFRKIASIPNPNLLIEDQLKQIDPTTGLVISSDKSRRIGDFEAQQNNEIAARDAYAEVNKQLTRIVSRIDTLQGDVRKLEIKRERESKAFEALSATPKIPLPDNEEAARQEKIKVRKAAIQALAEKRDQLQVRADVLSATVGMFHQKLNELAGVNQVRKPFIFGHGAEYWVPTRDDATGFGDGFEKRKIQLDSRNEITKKSELLADAERMGNWMAATSKRDGDYYQIEAMQREILSHMVATDTRKTDYTITGLKVSDGATQAKAFGTPLFRVVAQMWNRYTDQSRFLRPRLEGMTLAVERAKHEAMNIAGVNPDFYHKNFYSPAAELLRSRRDIAEKFAKSESKQFDEVFTILRKRFTDPIVNPLRANLLKGKEDRFMAALRRDLEANWAISQFLSKHNADSGLGVRDEKIDGERKAINLGVATIPSTVSDVFHAIFAKLAGSGWSAFGATASEAAEIYNTQDPDALREKINPFFSDPDIRDGFFGALVNEMATDSPFPAPMLEDGVTQPEANPAYARSAFEVSGGDPVTFFEKMYDLHDGVSDRGQYIQDGLMVFAQRFAEMRKVKEAIDPSGMNMPLDFKTMIPGFIVHARQIQHWPSSWSTFISFDGRTINRISERVAAQVAFGTHQERLISAYNAAVEEHAGMVERLNNAEAKIKQTVPSRDRKLIEAAIAKELGGVEELKRLRKLREMGKVLLAPEKGLKDQLIAYFNGKNSPLKTERFFQNLVSTFSSLMINQPGSALSQLAEVFTPFVAAGVSPQAIRMAMRNIVGTTKELAGGLVQGLGFSLERSDREYQRAIELGIGDPSAARKIKDILSEPGSPFDDESGASRTLRKFRQLQSVSVGSGQFTGARPLAPFTQSAIALHLVGTVNFWKEVGDMVHRGIEWSKNNPFDTSLADLTPEQWAKQLGLSGARKDGFVRIFQRALDDWGLDYFSLVKEGAKIENGGRDILTDKTLLRLQAMWIKETTSESNIATMNTSAFTNSALRFMLPLLGWGWRRTLQVFNLRYDEEGKVSYVALAKGMIGLAAMGAGGLAVSMLVDAYNEELLKKRRNLRRLDLDQDGTSLALALLEHSARVGTFGLFGDLANAAVDVGTGQGANRGISLDNRIVFANSVLGFVRATSAAINQRQIDYANVIRPVMYSLGGNGALQYLQMANGFFDLDNAEARATSRTNVSNWLRVAGREAGLEVRTSQGGYSSPTPMTPYITRMQLAALGGDTEDFMRAYREAVAEARRDGKEDPTEYVQKSFQSRHPLKTIFRTSPTDQDYRKILSVLPNQGREDVTQAINLYNRFGAMIGVRPFDGKNQKSTSIPSSSRYFGDSGIVDRARSFAVSF